MNDQCQKWKDSSNAEIVKGFHFMEKKLNHLENRVILEKLTSSIEKTLESKIKSYVNNLMQITMESVLNKQLQTMSHQMNERFDILEGKIKAELKPGITPQSNQSSQKTSNSEKDEQVRRNAADTQIKLTEIEDRLKLLDSRVQGGIAKNDVNRKMIAALDTKLTNSSNEMHSLHEQTLRNVTDHLQRIESEKASVGKMSLFKATCTKLEKMETQIKLITDKIDQNTTTLNIVQQFTSACGPVAETWMKLEEMQDSIKQLDTKVQEGIVKNDDNSEMIAAIDTKLADTSQTMHSLHGKIMTDVTSQMNRLEAEIRKMEKDAGINHRDISTTVERMEDPIKLITDKVDQNTTKLETIEELVSSTGPTVQMVEQLEKKVEKIKNLSHDKLNLLHTTLQDVHNETKSCSNSMSDISCNTSKGSEDFSPKSSGYGSQEIINENKNNLLKVCNKVLRKVHDSNKAMVDSVVDSVMASTTGENNNLSRDSKKHIQKCCDTLLENVKNELTQSNTFTRELFKDPSRKIDLIVTNIKPIGNGFKNEFKTLHNKIDKHNEELMSVQSNILKAVADSKNVCMSSSEIWSHGEVQNSLTMEKGKDICL